MTTSRLIVMWVAAAICAACQQSAVDYESEGAALLAPFKADLKAALIGGLQEGPAAAIGACRVEAPRIAAGLSVEGVAVGRSSHKLRNPENAPADWLVPVLRRFADGSSELAPVALPVDDARMGYVEPILMQPMCLTCHGESLPAAIAAAIDEQYPEDQATGFAAGDFRGVFWVEFPKR